MGYGIGRKYLPIWISVSVSNLNQNSGFGRTLSPIPSDGTDTDCRLNSSFFPIFTTDFIVFAMVLLEVTDNGPIRNLL